MIYIEAPFNYTPGIFEETLFLAGGITGCPNWQKDVVSWLKKSDFTVFNPRREDFPIGNPGAAKEQITWEHNHLRIAQRLLFWFPCETLCPIVLYELGAWSMTKKQIFVGVHPDYKRRQDVEIQTRLARPDVDIVYELEGLVAQVRLSLMETYAD